MDNTNTIVFVCDKCRELLINCIPCKQKESVFNLGYNDGKRNNPKETTGFTLKDTGLYHAGYIKGVQDRD